MEKHLLKAFWNCGDNDIIQFALYKAHLNRLEKEVIQLMFLGAQMMYQSASKR